MENSSPVYPYCLWSSDCFLGVIVIVITISVNSARLRGWILVCQLLSYSFLMRVLVTTQEIHGNNHFYPYVQILGSIYGMWNLFDRSTNPSVSTQV